MNIMLTSVGRRAYLVKYFRDAMEDGDTLHIGNSHSDTVAPLYAHRFVKTPLIYDEDYIPFLLNYCREMEIDALLSLFDADLPILGGSRHLFEAAGVRLIVASDAVIGVANDKWETVRFLGERGFSVPRTFLSATDAADAAGRGEVSFPFVVKPRFGCGSISVAVAEDEEELSFLCRRALRQIGESYLRYESAAVPEGERVVIQETLPGHEYGCDIFCDLEGNFRGAAVKRKVAMRAGETDIAVTEDVPEIYEMCRRLAALTRHPGNMDVDVFFDGTTPHILEMNARFGGGYPFSHIAGCDLPRAILMWLRGEEPDESLFTPRIGVRGYKELAITAGE